MAWALDARASSSLYLSVTHTRTEPLTKASACSAWFGATPTSLSGWKQFKEGKGGYRMAGPNS